MLSDSLDCLIDAHQLKYSQVQQQQLQPPHAIDDNDYNLTFKKQVKGSLFSKQSIETLNKNIYGKTRKLEHIVKQFQTRQLDQILKSNYQLQDLQLILNQYELKNYLHAKIIVALTYFQMVINRSKRNSVLMNLRIEKYQAEEHKKQITQADLHRIYLLESLAVQLHKKIFLDSLRFNLAYSQFQKAQNHKQQSDFIEEAQDSNEFLDPNLVDKGKIEVNRNSIYYDNNRLSIFVQIFDTVIDKQKFQCFRLIKTYIHKISVKTLMHSPLADYIQPLQSDQQQSYEPDLHEQFYQESVSLNSQDIEAQKEQRILTINTYIAQLIKQIKKSSIKSSPKVLLKNYFTRWKIYFLMNMIKFIQNDPELSNDAYGGQKYEQYETYSDATSQITEHRNIQMQQQKQQIKSKKYLLKKFLIEQKCCQFLTKLKENSTNSKLKEFTKQLYASKLMKKAMRSLVINTREVAYSRQLQSYAEQIANDQIQDYTLSKIFQRTNLITKTFICLNRFRKASKMCLLLKNLQKVMAIRLINHQALFESKQREKIERIIEHRKKLTLFKYFSSLKNICSHGFNNTQKVRNYLQNKQYDLKAYYFSLLKLLVKIKYTKIKKVHDLGMITQGQIFLRNLQQNYDRKIANQNLQLQISLSLQDNFKTKFLHRFINYHIESLNYQKLIVKTEKVKTLRAWEKAREGLKRWRILNLKKKSYRAIQIRLIKYKQREFRQKLFKIWFHRLQDKKSRNKLKDNHKIWLQKYYDQLCIIEK